MLTLVKKVFSVIKRKHVRTSPYPHLDAMNSAQLGDYLASDEVTLDEFTYIIKRRGWLVRHGD